MDSLISGKILIQVLETFGETADNNQLAELCQEVGLPFDLRENTRYPVMSFNRLIDIGCQRFWPELTLQEGQFRQGERAIVIFINSLAGKVGMALSGNDIKKLAFSAPSFYQAIATSGTVTYVDTGEKSYCLQFRGFESSAHFHYGALAAFTESMAPNAKFRMKILKQENPAPGVYLSEMDFIVELP